MSLFREKQKKYHFWSEYLGGESIDDKKDRYFCFVNYEKTFDEIIYDDMKMLDSLEVRGNI